MIISMNDSYMIHKGPTCRLMQVCIGDVRAWLKCLTSVHVYIYIYACMLTVYITIYNRKIYATYTTKKLYSLYIDNFITQWLGVP